MDGLFKYLARYKSLEPPNASTVKILSKTIKDECGIQINESKISIKRGGAILDCHPTTRSELSRYTPNVIDTLRKKHNIRLSYIR